MAHRRIGDSSAELEQLLVLGAQPASQRRVCLSVFQGLGDGRLRFTDSATEDERVARWPALLRSQQQHELLIAVPVLPRGSGALSDHSSSVVSGEGWDAKARLQVAKETYQSQAREIESLRQVLAESSRRAAGQETPEAQRHLESSKAEISRLEGASQQQKQEVAKMRSEVSRLRAQANQKINAANEKMTNLRLDRDSAKRSSSSLQEQLTKLDNEVAQLEQEVVALAKNKEQLAEEIDQIERACESEALFLPGSKTLQAYQMKAALDSSSSGRTDEALFLPGSKRLAGYPARG